MRKSFESFLVSVTELCLMAHSRILTPRTCYRLNVYMVNWWQSFLQFTVNC